MFDCIVIGGGVVGCAILDSLSEFGYNALLIEKEDDVAIGASRANSGIVHAGYDCIPNTLKARFNVEGNKMFESLCKRLDILYNKCGSLVLGDEKCRQGINDLYLKGLQNGVDVEIIEKDKILKLEPNVSDNISVALYAPNAGVVSPYKLTIALADSAILNGAEIMLNSQVTAINYNGSYYTVITSSGSFDCKVLINSAGGSSAYINNLANAENLKVTYAKGEYFILDSTEEKSVSKVLFPLPDENGKGILVAPTADGNVIYGPTSTPTTINDTEVSVDGLAAIKKGVSRIYKKPNYRKVIRLYAGVRVYCGDDFVIKKSEILQNYIMLVGICSPGLTAAPAIAEYVKGLVCECIPVPKSKREKVTFKHKKFVQLSKDEHNELVKQDERWGRIICRCEKVTEAEIVNAIHSPLKATTVDAIKRRVRAGMGRCQGGFCMPRIIEILARELNIPITAVKKGGENSEIAICKIKEVNDENKI